MIYQYTVTAHRLARLRADGRDRCQATRALTTRLCGKKFRVGERVVARAMGGGGKSNWPKCLSCARRLHLI